MSGMLDRVQTVDLAFSIGKVLAGGEGLLPNALVITREAERDECRGRENREET